MRKKIKTKSDKFKKEVKSNKKDQDSGSDYNQKLRLLKALKSKADTTQNLLSP